jgi:hypothetical protein
VFSFQSGEFINEAYQLDQDIFNVPLRKDIVHSVYLWRINYNKKTTHIVRNKATVSFVKRLPAVVKSRLLKKEADAHAKATEGLLDATKEARSTVLPPEIFLSKSQTRKNCRLSKCCSPANWPKANSV